MWMKWMRAAGAVLLGLLAGCGKGSNSAESARPVAAQGQNTSGSSNLGETIARVHWLGMKQLAGETNATNFMAIWNLPESQKLEAQTLDKLATAPWRLLLHQPSTNALTPIAASPLLRPLLDDLVNAESYLEITQETNKPGQLALAIRLDSARASLWQTNLAGVLESLTGVKPTIGSTSVGGNQPGFSVKKHHEPNLIELVRFGDWTVIGLAQDRNALMRDMTARIEKNKNPFAPRTTNFWIEADVDPARVAQALPRLFHLPDTIAGKIPRVTLSAIGDGQNVHTRGEFNFPQPLPIKLEPWVVPTNLIKDPLISFTAVQGVADWVARIKALPAPVRDIASGQAFMWAMDGSPLQTYFAVPIGDATNKVSQLCDYVTNTVNPKLIAHDMGNFTALKSGTGIEWTGNPFMSPFMEFAPLPAGNFLFGGLLRTSFTSHDPAPAELFNEVVGKTNVLFYDWEVTEPRLRDWLFHSQFARLFSGKAQLPPKSAALLWMLAIAPKLGNCVTLISLKNGSSVSVARTSTIGFASPELHLLADWLESPEHPYGLHTFLAKEPDPHAKRARPGPTSPGGPAQPNPK
jgi:hypothetical protein